MLEFEKRSDILKEMLFLILFFKVDGFTFRYPMDVFYTKEVNIENILKLWEGYNKTSGSLQFYMHSVFCGTRCHYCDCRSLTLCNRSHKFLYKKYLLDYIKLYSQVVEKEFDSLYFGGGTFNLWTDNEIKELITALRSNFELSSNYVWQVEIHPYFLTKNTLKILKDFGVTDIMLGVQTISSKVNKLNNRPFDFNKIIFALEEIKKLKFRKVSFDFLYNLPYMTVDDTIKDMEFIYEQGRKLRDVGIQVNIEINRWDISMKTTFANIFLKKFGKKSFFEVCKYYFKQSNKLVKLIDYYIDNKFLDLFDTSREEIEARKLKNTAILGIGLSATSYVPGKIVYEDMNYNGWLNRDIIDLPMNSYFLNETDNYLSYISDNLRRWIPEDIFEKTLILSKKFKDFYLFYKHRFYKKNKLYFFRTNSDIENDLLNLYLIQDDVFFDRYKYLIDKWKGLGFSLKDLENNYLLFLDYYYRRNRIYG